RARIARAILRHSSSGKQDDQGFCRDQFFVCSRFRRDAPGQLHSIEFGKRLPRTASPRSRNSAEENPSAQLRSFAIPESGECPKMCESRNTPSAADIVAAEHADEFLSPSFCRHWSGGSAS